MKNLLYIKIISVSLFYLFSSVAFAAHVQPISHHIQELRYCSPTFQKSKYNKVSEQALTKKQKELVQSFSRSKTHVISIEHLKDAFFLLYEYKTYTTLKPCYTTIEKALNTLAHVKGFIGLMKMLILTVNQPNTFAGFLYELEKGLDIHTTSRHEHVLEFQQVVAIPNSSRTREFDIVTTQRIIECKNINWKKNRLRKQFLSQKRVVEKLNKKNKTSFVYEVCSKKRIPQSWQEWFKKNKIRFSSDEKY